MTHDDEVQLGHITLTGAEHILAHLIGVEELITELDKSRAWWLSQLRNGHYDKPEASPTVFLTTEAALSALTDNAVESTAVPSES